MGKEAMNLAKEAYKVTLDFPREEVCRITSQIPLHSSPVTHNS